MVRVKLRMQERRWSGTSIGRGGNIESEPIPYVPGGNFAIRLQWWKGNAFGAAFTRHQNALMLFQVTQLCPCSATVGLRPPSAKDGQHQNENITSINGSN
jgi:hypothetical protein